MQPHHLFGKGKQLVYARVLLISWKLKQFFLSGGPVSIRSSIQLLADGTLPAKYLYQYQYQYQYSFWRTIQNDSIQARTVDHQLNAKSLNMKKNDS